MEKITRKGETLLAPLPAVLVTCGTTDKPAGLTIAWTGITCSEPPKTYISVRPSRNSYNIIKETGEFVINMFPSHLVRSLDYCGVRSQRDEDKLAKMKLVPQPCSNISAPQIAQAVISLECRVCDVIPLGSHDMFMADIVAVNVSKDIIDERGKVRIEQAGLLTYAQGTYFALGKKIGSLGYSVKPKRPKNPHRKKK